MFSVMMCLLFPLQCDITTPLHPYQTSLDRVSSYLKTILYLASYERRRNSRGMHRAEVR